MKATNSAPATRSKLERISRLRGHALILGIVLWSVYLWNISSPGLIDRGGNFKGTDFLHFYVLGSLARAHRGQDLYNMRAQEAWAAERIPAAAGIRYLPLYPPQVSLIFAPLARLPYAWALGFWLCSSALIYFACCYAMWRVCPNLSGHGVAVAMLSLGFPAFWHLVAWGQTSALALLCFVAAFFALRSGREFCAGVAFGLLVFKPQLGLAAAIIFLLTFRWRILLGAILSAVAELMAGVLYYGWEPLRLWMNALRAVPSELALLEPRIYQTHSLRTFWTMLLPWASLSMALYVVSGILVCGLLIACWRSAMPLGLRYSALLLGTALVAPHLTVYDLTILAPIFLLMADWMAARPSSGHPYMAALLYAVYLLPLLGPFARFTHLQLSVPAMAGLLYGIWTQRGLAQVS